MLIDKEYRMVEIKLEALRRQMNPHFTFNSINSLQYYILKNETDLALGFLSKFSNLIRSTLEISAKDYISISEEISYLETYFCIENSRVNNKVKLYFGIGEGLDIQSSYIPTMLIQPFIENAFVHAFPILHLDPIIRINFDKIDDNLLQCKIIDNGIGFKLDKISCGINLVKEQLSLLPDMVPEAFKIFSILNEGTQVSLTFRA